MLLGSFSTLLKLMKEDKLDKGLIHKGGLRSNSPSPQKNPPPTKKQVQLLAQAISEAKKSEVELILKKIIWLLLAGLVCKPWGQTRAWRETLTSPAAHKAAPTPHSLSGARKENRHKNGLHHREKDSSQKEECGNFPCPAGGSEFPAALSSTDGCILSPPFSEFVFS